MIRRVMWGTGTAPKKLMQEFPEKVGANVDCRAASCLPETNP